MKTIIAISNFSFESCKFSSFKEIEEQFNKLNFLKGKFFQYGVSLSLAKDILKDKYFGQSLETQFDNFYYGHDKQTIIAFRSKLERFHFIGFDQQYTCEDLKSLALLPDEAKRICCVLYTPTIHIPKCASIKSVKNFDSYYEKILGKYPIDEESYYQRASSHFTKLLYHDDCEKTLSRVPDGFNNYSIAITKCLSALNSLSPMSKTNLRAHLLKIASVARYACTAEGSSHAHFKFSFSHESNEYPKLDCQYHLKPSDRNIKGDGSHNHKRIYFGFIPVNDNELRIAVAAIGPHITIHDSSDIYAPEKTKRKKVKRRGNS